VQSVRDEGGPAAWPAVSRELLEAACPAVFELVDEKWPEYWKSWKEQKRR
jgi:hypothetical protein